MVDEILNHQLRNSRSSYQCSPKVLFRVFLYSFKLCFLIPTSFYRYMRFWIRKVAPSCVTIAHGFLWLSFWFVSWGLEQSSSLLEFPIAREGSKNKCWLLNMEVNTANETCIRSNGTNWTLQSSSPVERFKRVVTKPIKLCVLVYVKHLSSLLSLLSDIRSTIHNP